MAKALIDIQPRSRITFWIHRILEEDIQKLKKLADEISLLAYQAQYFDSMHPQFQGDRTT
jgi:hypothetical protein